MEILKCKICRRAFYSAGSKICGECSEQIEEDYKTVRTYLRDNEYAEMEKVSKETGVSMKVIMYLLKDGRIEIGSPDGSSVGGGVLFCEVCKKPIKTGKMCDNCKRQLAVKMQRSVAPVKDPEEEKKKEDAKYSKKSGAKMHVDHLK